MARLREDPPNRTKYGAVRLFGLAFATAIFISMLVSLAYSADVQCWNGTNGAISWWTLNETAGATVTDVCGVNDFTATSVTRDVTGIFSKGDEYDGINDFSLIANPSSSTYQFNDGDSMSICGWVYPHDQDNLATIFGMKNDSHGTDGSNLDYRIEYSTGGGHDGELSLTLVNNGNGIVKHWSTIDVNTTEWTHFCVTVNESTETIKWYLNNSVTNTSSFTGVTWKSNRVASALLGHTHSAAASWWFDGVFDEICWFNYSLSSAEVSNIFNNNRVGQTGAALNSTLSLTLSFDETDEQGYVLAYYRNTTSNLITGASCTCNITDPIDALNTSAMTEHTNYYRTIYVPDMVGTYNVSVKCSKAGYNSANATGTFDVSMGITTSITFDISDEAEHTNRTCSGDDIILSSVKEVCVTKGNSTVCRTLNVSQTVSCEHGCHDGRCVAAPWQLTGIMAVMIFIVVITLIAVALK